MYPSNLRPDLGRTVLGFLTVLILWQVVRIFEPSIEAWLFFGARCLLRFVGMDAIRTGTKLLVFDQAHQSHTINFARSVTTNPAQLNMYIAAAAAVAFIPKREWWQSTVIMISAAPVGSFLIALRVAIALWWIGHVEPGGKPEGVSGFLLTPVAAGLTLVPALLLLLLVGEGLRRVFIDEQTTSSQAPQDANRRCAPS